MASLSGEALIAIEWILISIAFCLILVRLNLRVRILGESLILSDYLIISAFLTGVALNAVDLSLFLQHLYQGNYDYELSTYVAPDSELVSVLKRFYGEYFPFYIEQYLNKASLIALYYEIFRPDSVKLQKALFGLVLYCGASFIITMCMVLGACPWGCYWSLTDPCPEVCRAVSDNLGWGLHFSSDLMIFLLPLIYIYKTKMSKAQKISASVTFFVGAINISVTIARWFVVQAVFTPTPSLTVGQLLAIMDGHTGLIVAILPSLRPYLRVFKGADLSSRPREVIKLSDARSHRTLSTADDPVWTQSTAA
ncbi:hypothetical protein BX600DRAFT_444264 [Xylariales sp. PMI_506]|nr:hypothetical protein BX600DRAFT_444264 [Xylariales sp. PMI_506]